MRKEEGRRGFELKIAWIAAHSGAEGNEMVDRAAKEAAEGMTDSMERLPAYLVKKGGRLPASLSAMKQAYNAVIRQRWREKWAKSPRYSRCADLYEDDHLFAAFKGATKGAARNQFSLLVQLHTGHVPLNKHLHRLGKVNSDVCNACKLHAETVTHYLLECCGYDDEREKMLRTIRRQTTDLGTLFGSREGIKATLQYVEDTGRLRNSFGDVSPQNLIEMDDDWEVTGEDRGSLRRPDEGEG